MKFFKSLLNIIDSPVVVPFLLCFGVIFRLVLSLVLFKASHHDEWFQVFDLPNLMVFGESRDMGEVHFHLRNLSLYWLCTLPIIALDALGFDAPYYRISFVRGSVAVLDMCIPLSAWRTAIKLDPKLNRKWQVAIVVFFSFIWFRLRVAPATSLEHFSEIAMWLTFACSVLAKRKSFVWYGWTGFFLVLIGLFRYPSGAFSLGFAMALVGTLARRKEWRSIVALSFGLVVALIGGGVADYVYYGRPYESLWMYLQYNVWSGLAGETFGRASTWVYAQHFINRLGGGLTIISVIFGYFGLKYFWKRMREIDPLCFGLVFFMVAHFIPSHKEARFMEPMLSFFLWFGLLGLNDVWPEIKKFLSQKPIGLAKGIVFVAVLSFLVNGVHVLVLMRGDYGKPFFNAIIAHSFPEDKNDCMIVSDRMIPWSFFSNKFWNWIGWRASMVLS